MIDPRLTDSEVLAQIADRLPKESLSGQLMGRCAELEKALRNALGATRLYAWKLQTGMHPDQAMNTLADTVEDICRPFDLNPTDV